MNKIEITQLDDEKLVIWYNGKNVFLNHDINIGEIIEILNKALNCLFAQI